MDQLIKMLVPRIHFAAADRFDDLVEKLASGIDLTVATLQALILLGRDHDGSVPAVAGDDDRLAQGQILVTADLFAELGRRYTDDVCHGLLREPEL